MQLREAVLWLAVNLKGRQKQLMLYSMDQLSLKGEVLPRCWPVTDVI